MKQPLRSVTFGAAMASSVMGCGGGAELSLGNQAARLLFWCGADGGTCASEDASAYFDASPAVHGSPADAGRRRCSVWHGSRSSSRATRTEAGMRRSLTHEMAWPRMDGDDRRLNALSASHGTRPLPPWNLRGDRLAIDPPCA